MFNQNVITGTSSKDNRLLICDAYALMCHNTKEKICHYICLTVTSTDMVTV